MQVEHPATTDLPAIRAALARHTRVAFQLSGGKDSVAALLLLRPFWDRLTVYYCDSGDAMPETQLMIKQLAWRLPRDLEIVPGRVQQVRAQFGLPTDLLPWTSAQAAHWLNTGSTPLMQDRVSCCFRSVMAPLHERMIADGMTLIIRGQKQSDELKGPLRSGMVLDGFEFLYPVEAWSDADCFAYVLAHGLVLPRTYAGGMNHSADCMTCTAWCEDNRADYLRQHHPQAFKEYRRNFEVVMAASKPAWANMLKEQSNLEV